MATNSPRGTSNVMPRRIGTTCVPESMDRVSSRIEMMESDMRSRYFSFWHPALVPALGLALLAACGTKAPEPVAKPVDPPKAAAPAPLDASDERPVIVCFGDSLSAGYGVEAGLSYPDFLQKELDRRGYRYRVVNLGVSGDTTSGGLTRIGDAIALKPDITILELGGNDGLRGIPVAQSRANLDKMAAALRDAGSQVVIAGMTLPPNYGPDYIRDFEQMYVEIAKRRGLPRIPFLLEGVALNRDLMQADGIHANVKGNEKVAQVVLRTLEPLLKR